MCRNTSRAWPVEWTLSSLRCCWPFHRGHLWRLLLRASAWYYRPVSNSNRMCSLAEPVRADFEWASLAPDNYLQLRQWALYWLVLIRMEVWIRPILTCDTPLALIVNMRFWQNPVPAKWSNTLLLFWCLMIQSLLEICLLDPSRKWVRYHQIRCWSLKPRRFDSADPFSTYMSFFVSGFGTTHVFVQALSFDLGAWEPLPGTCIVGSRWCSPRGHRDTQTTTWAIRNLLTFCRLFW